MDRKKYHDDLASMTTNVAQVATKIEKTARE
jgi:hypothetical protein